MKSKKLEKKSTYPKLRISPPEMHPKNKRGFFTKIGRLLESSPPEIVGSKPIEGEINSITKAKITKKINSILATSKNAKIGVTGDVWVRMDETLNGSYRGVYECVQEIYRSKKGKLVAQLEVDYIKKYQKDKNKKIDNVSTNIAPRLTSYDGFFRIYLVYNKA